MILEKAKDHGRFSPFWAIFASSFGGTQPVELLVSASKCSEFGGDGTVVGNPLVVPV